MRGRDFAATLALIAIPVAVACEPLASPLARLLGPGLSAADRAVTADALRILGGAMVLQLAAAGAATLLGVWDRFGTVAAAYVAGAVAGLVAFFAVKGPRRRAVAGLVDAGDGGRHLRLDGGRALRGPAATRRRAAWRPCARLLADAGLILGRTLVYFVINGLFLVTLAFVSHAARRRRDRALLRLPVRQLPGGGHERGGRISRVPDTTRARGAEWKRRAGATPCPHGFRYAMLVCAPALAGLVAAGAAHRAACSRQPAAATT